MAPADPVSAPHGSPTGTLRIHHPIGSAGAEASLAGASDGALLARCREGDAEAWDELVARYQKLIFSVALRNGLGREDAADVTQVTFLALLDSLDRLGDTDQLPAWLSTVARRQAWRLRRRTQAELAWSDTVVDADGQVSRWDDIIDLHRALQQLGDPCRTLLHALYLDAESPSYVVIARRLGRAVGSIGSLRARCLLRLQRLMGAAP